MQVRKATAQQLFAAVGGIVGDNPLRLLLDRDLVVSLRCEHCSTAERVMQPLAAVGISRGPCPDCGQPRRPELVHEIVCGSELADQTLAHLGIPPYDLVRVASGEDEHIILLAGDREGIWHEASR
jgi:hypothetical protein